MSQMELIPQTGQARKRCPRCCETKPQSEFHPCRGNADGFSGYCKMCSAAYLRSYRKTEPQRFAEYERQPERLKTRRKRDRERWTGERRDTMNQRRRAREVQRAYGITLEEYECLVAQPCAICGTPEAICLDHCHASGKVRGPLCRECNLGIGFFEDDIGRMEKAIEYLQSHAVLA